MLNRLIVTADGWLQAGDTRIRCALGRGGLTEKGGEGDGISPQGTYALRRVLYRADKLNTPQTSLPVAAIEKQDGWCDDPAHPTYNQQVTLPVEASAESLWRDDALYDVIVVLGYNDDPIVPGKGSAIFMHITQPDYSPTEGCVALAQEDLLKVLKDCGPETVIKLIADGS
jgi:L,D-peptidoglycan transpeptidase YkuD (ErfK/YbiS/YcfS/YnhG family)